MKYGTVLFDFDGTLMDTSEGILECVVQTLNEIHIPIPKKETLRKFIGPPIKRSFVDVCGIEEEKADQAVTDYRSCYNAMGRHHAEVYPGIEELLKTLRNHGVKLAVASVKMTDVVMQTMQEFAITHYFDAICGASPDINIRSKDHIIQEALERTNTRAQDALMVGDSDYDAKGAEVVGVDFCAVLWGFGFDGRAEAEAYPHVFIADTPADLERYVI